MLSEDMETDGSAVKRGKKRGFRGLLSRFLARRFQRKCISCDHPCLLYYIAKDKVKEVEDNPKERDI